MKEAVGMPAVDAQKLVIARMHHAKGSTRQEMLTNRAVRLCQEVIRPTYLNEIQDKYQPQIHLHLARQAAQLKTVDSKHMHVVCLILDEVEQQQLALEGLRIIVDARHTLNSKMAAQGCHKDAKEPWDLLRKQMQASQYLIPRFGAMLARSSEDLRA